MKSTILFILHMPPPVHGASMMGKYIHDSKIVSETFDCHYINLTTAKDLADIGKVGLRKLIQFAQLLNHIRKEVKRLKPKLVYVTPNACGGAFYKDFVVVQLLKSMGCNVVAHYHNKGVATRQDKPLDNFLYTHFFKGLKVILLSDVLYEDIKKYVAKEDVFFCPNGIPNTQRPKFKRPDHLEVQILFLSNMIATKGVWELVEACSLLKKSGLKFKCHFVGKWNDITEYDFKTKIQQKELEDYIVGHGPKYGEDKIKMFQEADIFVFPTYYPNECFPIVLLEAMQYALPCISTNEGGIPDIIDQEKTGFIVEKKNTLQLANKISYLIKHAELRKQMGENGYKKFIKEFTLTTFEKDLKEILVKCCDTTY